MSFKSVKLGEDNVDYSAGDAASLAAKVTGPASATDNAVARFDLATGKLVQNSLVTIGDTGNVSLPALATLDGRDVSVDGAALDALVSSIPYKWVWANATARLATAATLTAADFGQRGYQTDIRLRYEVVVGLTGSLVLAQLPDPLCAPAHFANSPIGAVALGSSNGAFGLALTSAGTQTGRTAALGTLASETYRSGIATAASLGAAAGLRTSVGLFIAPYRLKIRGAISAVSTNFRWAMGVGNNTDFGANTDPAAALQCFFIGRSVAGDLCLFRNDSTAGAVSTTLTGMSSNTVDTLYEFDIAMFTAALWAYNVRNATTGLELSGTFTTRVPTTTSCNVAGWTVNNGADSSITSIEACDLSFSQFLTR
jgi:hypothetical protein